MNGRPIGQTLGPILGLFVIFGGCILIVQQCTACALFESAEARYTTELVRCVDKATTLAESKECRRQADYRWGIAQTVRAAGGDQ